MLNMAVKITKIKNNITQNRPTDTNVHPRCIRIKLYTDRTAHTCGTALYCSRLRLRLRLRLGCGPTALINTRLLPYPSSTLGPL